VSRTIITERVECSISPILVHDVQIVIVDNVVKAISSPCDRVAALAAAQLGGASCAHVYNEIRERLTGDSPLRAWVLRPDADPVYKAAKAAEERRRGRR
jgi:hypothetical protein